MWGEIVAQTAKKELKVEPSDDGELMTLEDFLAKADAKVEETEVVKVERLWSDAGVYGRAVGGGIVSERSGVEEGRKGKRRVESLDKVVMQRQRRMIKNRESAARSRERKQVRLLNLMYLVSFCCRICFHVFIEFVECVYSIFSVFMMSLYETSL